MDSLRKLLAHPLTERTIITLILVNAVTLGLETSKSAMANFGTLLHAIDQIILWIFVVELAARIAVHRLNFFKDPWSIFDFIVVAIALIPATGSLSVLRALRVLRLLRLITVVPSLRKVVSGLVSALPGMGSIGLLLMLVYYVFAVMATKLFGETNPELFGTLGTSAYTLFQSMTFDDWSNGIVKPLVEKDHQYGWLFVIAFMIVSAFMVLNLFIGVVVTALDAVTDDGKPKLADEGPYDSEMLAELRALRLEVRDMRERMEAAG
ncbi:MAG: ion transporter [Beijerinckiaceae bacterium]